MFNGGGGKCFEMNYVCSSIEYSYYYVFFFLFFHYNIEREPRRPSRVICSTLKMSGSSIKTRQSHARNRLFMIARLQHCVPCTCPLRPASSSDISFHSCPGPACSYYYNAIRSRVTESFKYRRGGLDYCY